MALSELQKLDPAFNVKGLSVWFVECAMLTTLFSFSFVSFFVISLLLFCWPFARFPGGDGELHDPPGHHAVPQGKYRVPSNCLR